MLLYEMPNKSFMDQLTATLKLCVAISRVNLCASLVAVHPIPTLHFVTPPDDVEVTSGGDVNLTCVAAGSPTPMVTWRLGALEVTHGAEGESVLMLTDVRQSNTYMCVAESDQGSIEHNVEVKVKGEQKSFM